MKTRTFFSPVILMIGFLFFSATGEDPKDISEKAFKAIEFDALEMTATLDIIDRRGNKRTRRIKNSTKTFGSTTKTKIRFLAPAEVQGTTLLIYDHEDKDDDMWIYMPSMRRTRRIVSSERGNSFMGSEFTYADMSRPDIDNFNYRLLGMAKVDEKECYKIEAVFKSNRTARDYGYRKQIAYIDKDNYLTRRVEYYGNNDRLEKIIKISNYRKQSNGNYFAFRMEAENPRNRRSSVITINNFSIGSSLKESDFDVGNIDK